jgi:predicted ATP-grasp superfamily ATP-dependent carboligase
MIVQEYIGGNDDNHYDLHVYMDRNSEPLGCLTGRKIRIYPAYAGTGCFVESLYSKELVDLGVDMLRKVGFTGLANFNFKKDPSTQEFKLLEINPRASSWNIMDSFCGVNLPFIAYADAAGIPFALPGKQREQVKYVYLKSDIKAFLEYRRNGDWTLWSWLSSFRGKKVYQMYAPDDLRPFVVDLKRTSWNVVKRIVKGPQLQQPGRCACSS